MKIYLAAKYSRNPDMRNVRSILETRGHEVTSRWINGNHEISETHADLDRTRFAVEDFMDLRKAEVVLWFSEPENVEGRNRGGRHVEFGLALAWNKRIVVVGRKENVFHWLPTDSLEHFPDLEVALRRLELWPKINNPLAVENTQ